MTRAERAVAVAPASVGNVGSGFDVFGLALDGPTDEVEASPGEGRGVEIDEVTGDGGEIPVDPERNTAGVAVGALLRLHAPSRGVRLRIRKGIPLAAGLGGSAASAVAAVLAADRLLGTGLSREELLGVALDGEEAASGGRPPDNAAASLYGGWVLVREGDPPRVMELPVPRGLAVVVVRPRVEVRTAEARAVLGSRIPLMEASRQWSNTATVVAALFTGDLDALSEGLVDVVAEPRRAGGVPGFQAVQRAALEAGALGSSFSGSGPSVFALCRSLEAAERAGEEMRRAFREAGDLESEAFLSSLSAPGARVEEVSP